MKIDRLTLSNWMCFRGQHVLDLPSGAIAVVGRYGENARRSNWSGKTALLEAIRWCVWGVHRKRLDDGVIFTDAESASVRVEFSGGLVVERSRRRGGPSRVLVHVGAGTENEGAAAQDWLLGQIGLSYQDARATVLFEQGDSESLVGRTSAQRRETVAAWLDLALWDRLGSRARAGAASAQDALRALRAVPDEPEPRPVADVSRAIVEARAAVAAAEAAERAAQEGLERAQAAVAAETVERDLAAVRLRMRSAREQVGRLPVIEPERLVEMTAALVDAERAQGVAAADLKSARAMEGGRFDGMCPATRKACPVADRVRADVDGVAARIADATVHASVTRARTAAATSALDEPNRNQRERERLNQQFNLHAEQARALQARLDETLSTRVESVSLADAKTAVEVARTERAVATVALANLVAEQRSATDRAERSARKLASIEAAEREARRAALVMKALSPSGIQARVASSALVSLERRANALLVGSGLSFSLSWERELSDLAPACPECGYPFRGQREKSCPSCGAVRARKRSDELDVLVDDGSGEIEDARAKSGGARVLVATAVRLAGGLMLRERRGSRVSWALVDEPFGPLDGENRDALARTFTSMLGSVGLEQALVVSHDPALLDALPHRIVVTRDGSSSSVRIE